MGRESYGGCGNWCRTYRPEKSIGSGAPTCFDGEDVLRGRRVLRRRNGDMRDVDCRCQERIRRELHCIDDLPLPVTRRKGDLALSRRGVACAGLANAPMPLFPRCLCLPARRSCAATDANRPPSLLLALQKSHRTPSRMQSVVFSSTTPFLLPVPSTDARRHRCMPALLIPRSGFISAYIHCRSYRCCVLSFLSPHVPTIPLARPLYGSFSHSVLPTPRTS